MQIQASHFWVWDSAAFGHPSRLWLSNNHNKEDLENEDSAEMSRKMVMVMTMMMMRMMMMMMIMSRQSVYKCTSKPLWLS